MAKSMPVGTIRDWESGTFIKAHDSTPFASGWIPLTENSALNTLGSELDGIAKEILGYKEPVSGEIYLDHELEEYADRIGDKAFHPDNFKQYSGFYGAGRYSFRNQLSKKFMDIKIKIEEYVQEHLVKENVKKAESQGIYDRRKYSEVYLSKDEISSLRKVLKAEATQVYKDSESIKVSDFDEVKKIVYDVRKNLKKGFDLDGEELKLYHKCLYWEKDVIENYDKIGTRRKEQKELVSDIEKMFENNWALKKSLTDKVTDAYSQYMRKYKDQILVDAGKDQEEMFGVKIDEPIEPFYIKIRKKLKEDPEAPFQELMFLRFSVLYNKAFEGDWAGEDINAIENLERVINQLPLGHFINNDNLRLITNKDYKGGNHGGYAWYSSQDKRINFSDKCVREGNVFGVLSNQSEFNTVVAHEIGHAVSFKLGRSNYYDYKRFAVLCGWSYQQEDVKNGTIITGDDKNLRREGRFYTRPLLTNYAHKSPEEAFAEYYSFYFSNKETVDSWLKTRNEDLLSQRTTTVFDNSSPILSKKVFDFMQPQIEFETIEKFHQEQINRKLVFNEHCDFKLVSSSDCKFSQVQEQKIKNNKYFIRDMIKNKVDVTSEGISIAIEKNGKYNVIENGALVKAGFYLKKPINVITVSDEYYKNMQSAGFSNDQIKSYLLLKFNDANLKKKIAEPKTVSGLVYRDKIIDKNIILKNRETLAMMQTIFNSDELQKAIDDLFYKSEDADQGAKNYADSVILYYSEDGSEPKVLFLMRSKLDDFHPGVWCLPGGKVEKDEHPTDGAIRELFEETGIINKKIVPILIVKKKDCKIHYYQGYSDKMDSVLLDNDEHINYNWFSVSEIKEMNDDMFILDLKERVLEILNPDFKVKTVDETNRKEDIEKSEVVTFYKGRIAQEGEVRTWGGKQFRKQGSQWVPVTQGKGPKKEEEQTQKQPSSQEDAQAVKKYNEQELSDLAKKASEKDLKRVISESKQEKIRKIAQSELQRRKKEEYPQSEPDKSDEDFKNTWGINDQENQNDNSQGSDQEYEKKSAEMLEKIKSDRTDSYGDFYEDNHEIAIKATESLLKEMPELFQNEEAPYIADTLTTDMNFIIDSFPDREELKRDDLSWTISSKISDEQLGKINSIMTQTIKDNIQKFHDKESERLKEATDNFHSASDNKKSSAAFEMEWAEERFEKVDKMLKEFQKKSKVEPQELGVSDSEKKLFKKLTDGSFRKLSRDSQLKLIKQSQKNIDKKESEMSSAKNYDDTEMDALDTYVSEKYKDINAYLRGQTDKISPELKKDIDTIDRVMSKNKIEKPIVVYRAVQDSNATGKDNAYKSTSIDLYTANNFKRGDDSKIRAYQIPAGTNAVYIGGGEKELLLPRDFDLSKYEVNF